MSRASDAAARRLLLVHAHPDDETITTGATMAHYAAAGVHVTLLTCTLGEQGEIAVDALQGLAAEQADQLGGYRIGELTAAMQALGVRDHRFLGGAGRFRDSGMLGTPANEHPRAFWRAATDTAVFDDAVAAAVQVIREVRPQVVVTYDPNGDYGHPDHVMAHRVGTEAVHRAADATYLPAGDPWRVAKLYWTATPLSGLRAGYEATSAAATGFTAVAPQDMGFGVPDDVVTAVVDAPDSYDAKRAALEAHRTQLTVRGDLFALTNGVGRLISAVEHFRLVDAAPGGPLERDLFAGVAPDAATIVA